MCCCCCFALLHVLLLLLCVALLLQVVSARELEALGVSAVLDLRQPAVLCKTERRNLWESIRWGVGWAAWTRSHS